MRVKPAKRMDWTPERKAHVRELRKAGWPIKRIAEEYEVSKDSVRCALHSTKMGRDTPWPPARINAAKRLYLVEGKSALDVGKLLGCSRNAIAGLAYRQGWPAKPVPVRKVAVVRQARLRKAVENHPWTRSGRVSNPPAHGVNGRSDMPTPTPLLVDLSRAKPLLERRQHECAFPVHGYGADTLFCCARADDIYCVDHLNIMRQPAKGWLSDSAIGLGKRTRAKSKTPTFADYEKARA